jgi:hypothetical protein
MPMAFPTTGGLKSTSMEVLAGFLTSILKVVTLLLEFLPVQAILLPNPNPILNPNLNLILNQALVPAMLPPTDKEL